MRPARGDRRSPQKVKDGHTDVREKMIVILDGPVVRDNTGVVPLSVEVEEFSLRTVPKNRVPTGEGLDGSGNCVPSWEVHGGVVGRSEAVVSTTAVAGRHPRPTLLPQEEFSLRTVPKNRVPTGEGSDGSGNCVPSWEVHGGVVGRSDAVVSTTAVVGAASPADLAHVCGRMYITH